MRLQRVWTTAAAAVDAAPSPPPTALTAEDFGALSQPARAALADAVREMNPIKLASALDRLRDNHPDLARTITHMAEAAQYRELLSLLEGQTP